MGADNGSLVFGGVNHKIGRDEPDNHKSENGESDSHVTNRDKSSGIGRSLAAADVIGLIHWGVGENWCRNWCLLNNCGGDFDSVAEYAQEHAANDWKFTLRLASLGVPEFT